MSLATASARPRIRGIRTFVLGLVALALVSVGSIGSAPVARAATSASFSGVGSGASNFVSLDAGLYEIDLTYSGNINETAVAEFWARLDAQGAMEWILADDFESDNTLRRVVELPSTSRVWVSVKDAADDAAWSVEVRALTPPTEPVTSFTYNGTGPRAATPYRVAKGEYWVTYRYSNNVDAYGPSAFFFGLNAPQNYWLPIVDVDQDTSGSGSRMVTFPETGVYWFEAVFAGKNAPWQVSLAPMRTLTLATPKISGTAKVGRTVKVKTGTWTSGTKLTYQWYRGSKKISGATKSSYAITSSSLGKKLKVKVKGTKAGYYTVTRTSASTATVKR